MDVRDVSPPYELNHLHSTGEKLPGHGSAEFSNFEGFDTSSPAHYTDQDEEAILRKIDLRVVGLVAVLYLLSFLDRSNIGNAKIAGLVIDLNLSNNQYEWLLTGFYLAYISFQGMALIFRIIPAHIYLAIVVFSWGVLASLQSLTTSFASLLVLRLLLGISEAAFTGVPFYLSFFYRREELAFRTGVFIAAAPLATSFASSLAWVITWIAQDSRYIASWRLLFLVEGFPSVLMAWYCYAHVVDSIGTAWFLNSREKRIASQRLEVAPNGKDESAERQYMSRARRVGHGDVSLSEIMDTLKDSKSYFKASILFCCNVAFSSMPVFLPTIVKEMGMTSMTAQALSAPPYIVSFITVILVAYWSDMRQSRSFYIIIMSLLACFGYLLIFLAGIFELPNWIRYFGLYPACMGFFTCVTLIITWQLNNQESETKKGAGIAILQFVGQCGPILGTRLFPFQDGPLYSKGMIICSTFMGLVAILALGLRLILAKENAKRLREAGVDESESSKPLVGDTYSSPKDQVFLFIL